MYKDKDKQREANKLASRRRRDKTQGMTNEGMTAVKEHTQRHTLNKPKRGKDIKCFADLPPDVQHNINKMSKAGGMIDGKIDQTIKAKRTAIAINYQHLYPDRYYSTGAN